MRRSAALATLLRDVGLVLHLTPLLTAVTLPVAVAAGDRWAVLPLVATGAGAGIVGQLLWRRFERADRPTTRMAVAVVALAWLVTGLLAALVLWWLAVAAGPLGGGVAVYRDPVNALFEGISGVTSTGLTMADGLESTLPPTVQWWRSLLQWIGAVGVILFTLAVASTGASGQRLYESAARPETLGGDARTTARRIWALYLLLTALAIVGLRLSGLDWWTTLNHGITGIGTGGFTITDGSFGEHPPASRYVGAAIILVGATSFAAHHQLLARRDLGGFLRRTQVRTLALGLLVGLPLLAVAVYAQGPPVAAVDVVFQWATALGTAGFSTVDLSAWGPPALLLLIVAMVVGGASGSTAGGLKLSRVAWLAKATMVRIRTAEPGHAEHEHVWDGQRVGDDESRRAQAHAAAMALLWVATLLAGTFIVLLLVPGRPAHHVAFDVASALSNVGLDTGVVSRDLGGPAKATFTALMLLGRLEVLGVVVLVRSTRVHGPEDGATERPPPGA